MKNTDKLAKKLEKELHRMNRPSKERLLQPLKDMAAALLREAGSADNSLPKETALKQRAFLMDQAKNMQPQKETKKTSGFSLRPPLVWAGSLSTVAIVALVAIFVFTNVFPGPNITPGLPLGERIARLIIPVAYAADAFTFQVEDQNAGGAEPDTSFIITSKIDLTADTIKDYIHVVPTMGEYGGDPIPVTASVEEIEKNKFRVTPTETLDGGRVYKISLATIVQGENDEGQARDFSWAIQTNDVFKVLSSVPGPDAGGVPVNTGIEFTMSQEGWSDPAPFWSITPDVKGRFERHNRSMTFVPEEPLAYGQIYVVTMKSGWGIENSDRNLGKDIILRFETVPPPRKVESTGPLLQRYTPQTTFVTKAPAKEYILNLWPAIQQNTAPAKVTGYMLTTDQAKTFLIEQSMIPRFAEVTRNRKELYEKYAKTEVFGMELQVEKREDYYYDVFVRIPAGIDTGLYLVKLTSEDPEPTWFFMQSTNLGNYIMSDEDETLVWTLDVQTGKPLTGLPIAYDGADVVVSEKTDGNGLARIMTPPIVNTTSTEGITVMTLGEGENVALALFESQYGGYWSDWRSPNDENISYFHVDRPLYHPTDSAEIFGMIRDRKSDKVPTEPLTLELRRNGFYWYWSDNEEKVYRKSNVTADANGFFQTKIDWKNLAPNWYKIVLKRGDTEVFTKSFEVRPFVKPSFTLDVALEKDQIFAGEPIRGNVIASFFNGAPVANMDLMVQGGDYSGQKIIKVKTDDSGRASFELATELLECEIETNPDAYCSQLQFINVTANPTEGEEAEISATDWLRVWQSKLSLNIRSNTEGNNATIDIDVKKNDLTRLVDIYTEGTEVVELDPAPGVPVKLRIVEHTWEKIETGTGYDYIEKRTYKTYRWEERKKEVANVDLGSDANGHATYSYTMTNDDAWYAVKAYVKDERGVVAMNNSGFRKNLWGSYDDYYYYSDVEAEGLRFKVISEKDAWEGRSIGEEITVGFTQGGTQLPASNDVNFLYVESKLGIVRATATGNSSYTFTFGEEHVPNMSMYGIAFRDGGFYEEAEYLSFNTADRALTIELTPDKAEYAPGAIATLDVDVKDKDGNPVPNTHVSIAAVDEALFAAANGGYYFSGYDSGESPLGSLYGWVSSGILFTKRSHERVVFTSPGGGAEMGGGGGFGDAAVRRDFKDTAFFAVAETNRGGEAKVEIKLPDNLTSWRLSAVGISDNLYAGYERTNIKVTLPVFVDIVIPEKMLSADKPKMKLRGFGAALQTGEAIEFLIDAPTLGITNRIEKGTAGQALYVELPNLIPGEHAVIVGVKSKRGVDKLEKKLFIAESRFLSDEYNETPLTSDARLPDFGSTNEASIVFIPRTKAVYLNRLRGLRWSWSERLEAQVAARIADKLLKSEFNDTEDVKFNTLNSYQKESGGLAILPHASDEVELSSKIATVDPSYFDRDLLDRYFWDKLADEKNISREEQARALAGLASLGEPVLTRLQAMSDVEDLTWREQLAVMTGLAAIGDIERSRGLFDKLMAQGESQNEKFFLKVSDDRRDNVEATAEAMRIALMLADSKAQAMHAWLGDNWAEDAFTPLDQIAYVKQAVQSAIGSDVTVRYELNGEKKTIELKDGYSKEILVTAEEAASFKIIESVGGPAVMTMVRSIAKRPAQSPHIALTRNYMKLDDTAFGTLKEADRVRVELVAQFDVNAPQGCYMVRDHVPAGLVPLEGYYGYGYYEYSGWYASRVEDQAVTFTICHWTDKPETDYIRYDLRVQSKGDYLAEPAVMQHDESTDVAALSSEQRITIE